MRVKHASQVLSRSGAARPPWQRSLLAGLRGLAGALRAVAHSPVWPWLGGLVKQGAVRLEQWVQRL